jgi:hypothetical protein
VTAPSTCSRAGCREPALRRVNWRNPRIHSPDRVKVWLACGDHDGYLHDYLASRGFPVVVTDLAAPLAELPA